MHRLLLDTSVIIALLRSATDVGPTGLAARGRMTGVGADTEVVLSSLVFAQLSEGFSRDPRATRQRARFERIAAEMTSHDFGTDAASAFGRISAALRKSGTRIGDFDTLIAAHAVALGADIATLNARDFQRVPGLRVQDWSR